MSFSLLRTAWLSDDAYITFRTVDNILNGFGPTWNVNERVQAFSHPLWMMVCTISFGVTQNVYYSALALGAGLTFACLWLLVAKLATTPRHVLIVLATVLSSKAWIDYSTSGLENPLSHVLLLLFIWQWFDAPDRARLSRLAVVAGLCALNRLDTILLVGPALLAEAVRAGLRPAARAFLVGFSPLLIWLVFAVFYYGSPFPNTAYAKLNGLMPLATRLERGVLYLVRTLVGDPVTLPAMALAVMQRPTAGRADLALRAGIPLYLAYIVRVGGDEMMGRFLTAPLALAIGLIARARWPSSTRLGALAPVAILVVGLAAPWEPAILSGFGYARARNYIAGPPTVRVSGQIPYMESFLVLDERRFWDEATGLMRAWRAGEPLGGLRADGLSLRNGGDTVTVRSTIGIVGYYAGPGVHIVDELALADALLARIPGGDAESKIGHFLRRVPDGYLDSLRTGENRIADPNLAAYYSALHEIIAGPLWSGHRLRVLAEFLLGSYDGYVRRYIETLPVTSG